MKPTFTQRVSLLIVLLVLTACQSTGIMPAVTVSPEIPSTPTLAPLPTTTPSPTPFPFMLSEPGWEGVQMDTVCISVDGIYEGDPRFADISLHEKTLKSLLQELGFGVSTDCDATLHMVSGYSTETATYITNDTNTSFDCVTRAYFSGYMVLTAPTRIPVYSRFEGEVTNEPQVTMDGCPEQAEVFETAWISATLIGLSHLVGPAAIVSMYESDNEIHRNAAFMASEALGPDDLDALPAVLRALKTQSEIATISSLATGIQNMGPQAQEAAAPFVPALLENLKTSEVDPFFPGQFETSTVETLGKLGAQDAVPVLVEMLESPNSLVAPEIIINALANIGPGAAHAVPVLIQKARDENDFYALEALGKIGPVTPEVVLFLMEQAQRCEKEPWYGCAAIGALGKMYPQSAEILPFLISIAQANKPTAASRAIMAIGNNGMISPEVYPMLKQSLRHQSEDVRSAAAGALANLGPALGSDTKEVIPTLISMVRTENQYSQARANAINALSVVGRGSPDVISLFAQQLETKNVLEPVALENLGPESRALAPSIIVALDANQFDQIMDITTLTEYIHALILVTGDYAGYKADDWLAWWEIHKNN